jgi:hypothetical protein
LIQTEQGQAEAEGGEKWEGRSPEVCADAVVLSTRRESPVRLGGDNACLRTDGSILEHEQLIECIIVNPICCLDTVFGLDFVIQVPVSTSQQ